MTKNTQGGLVGKNPPAVPRELVFSIVLSELCCASQLVRKLLPSLWAETLHQDSWNFIRPYCS